MAVTALITVMLAALHAQDDRSELNRAAIMAVTRLEDPQALASAARPVPSAPVANPFRVRLTILNAGEGTWTIVVTDTAGTTLETIEPGQFVENGYWTDEFAPGSVRIRLRNADAAAEVRVDRYAVQINLAQPQGIIGQDESKDIMNPAVPARARGMAGPIARLKFMDDASADKPGPSCSGFLVGRDLLMTNHHCVSAEPERASALVEFGANTLAAKVTRYRVLKIEASDRQLDYSLLRLSGSASQFGRLYIGNAATKGLRLLLIQHPDGKVKKAAWWPNCTVGSPSALGVDGRQVDFTHTCDTLGGSSGSPVLDYVSEQPPSVVGLHHWTYLPDVEGSLNQAVHIRVVVDNLAALVKVNQLSKAVLDEVARPRP